MFMFSQFYGVRIHKHVTGQLVIDTVSYTPFHIYKWPIFHKKIYIYI